MMLLKKDSNRKPLSDNFRMAVVYRSEKKKILRSQLNIIKKVNSVLQKVESTLIQKGFDAGDQNKAYTELLM